MDTVAVVIPVLLIGAFWFLVYKVTAPFRRTRIKSMERTTLARLGMPFGSNLPLDTAFIANAGSQGPAQTSIDGQILRPTIGLRALSAIGSAALLYFMWLGDPALFPFSDGIKLACTIALIYAAAYMFTYELRFDRDRMIARGWAFNRREHAWKDLVRIRDNGHYLYVLNFSNGKKLEIQKYLVGIDAFLALAERHISANNRGEQAPREKIRPGGSLFGERKTFS